ncbi:50S ribosomal protein L10 [Candidatus Micrarchaeota archaeon]|nr:50S ribosomal protein L10 [Candidatus Micrarchaeota archaeon]
MVEKKADVNRKTVKAKIQKVEEVKADLKKYKTLVVIDLRKLSDSLFQSLRKKIRDKGGKVLVLKKPVIQRVLESDKKLTALSGETNKPVALILTNDSPFAINKFFKENKKRRAAKTGEIAPFDIVVPEGETDLPPGPALSELKGAGINVQIKGGKIVVSKESVVAKSGETLNDLKTKALQKLNVKPFEISVRLIAGYDQHYIYSAELLNIDDTLHAALGSSLNDAFNLSINAKYPTKQNVEILLRDAYMQSLNVALNGNLYSSNAIGQLLTLASRQGLALASLGK